MIISIIITIFTTALVAVGIVHLIETGMEFWQHQKVLPLNLILFGIAIICFYIVALYAIWMYLPIG